MPERDWWLGVINGILYQIQFEQVLNGELAARTAQSIVDRPVFDLPIQENVDAIREALASDVPVTGLIDSLGTDQEVREFLSVVLARILALQPWPEIPYRRLDKSEFTTANQGPIARIGMSSKKIERRLGRIFLPVNDQAVLVLELKSGDVVSLVDRHWIPKHVSAGPGESLLYSNGARPAAEVIDAFRVATGFSAEEVMPLDNQEPA